MKEHDELKNEQNQIQETIHSLKQQGDWARLEKFLMACVEAYPEEYYFLTELSSVYYVKGNATEALATSQKAMAIEPRDVLVIYHYGMALFLNNQFNEAITQFYRIQCRKLHTIAYGQYGEGMKWAKSIVNDAVYMIGAAYMEKGDYKKAGKWIQRHLFHRRSGIYSDFTKRQVEKRLHTLSMLS